MPTHPDAIGYLNDLAADIDKHWFSMVCDIASIDGKSSLDQKDLYDLIALFRGKASYIGSHEQAITQQTITPASPNDVLDELSGFSNFKRLKSTLDIDLSKRISLIFGTNGSGKSSLCESLKVLSTATPPTRPLENVHVSGGGVSSFNYKFQSDSSSQIWTPASGYGIKQETVKYFDTAIAVKNITSAVDPGRVISLSPFKLNVFEWTSFIINQLRTSLQQKQNENHEQLTEALNELRSTFSVFENRALSTITENSVSCLADLIQQGKSFNDQELLTDKRNALAELEKATSDDGLRLLKAEYRELESLQASVNRLIESATELWNLTAAEKAASLTAKQAAQAELAKTLIPDGSDLDDFRALLLAASPLCNMEEASGGQCPLCKRELGDTEIELFKQYNNLLMDKLEKEIDAIKTDIAKADEFALMAKAVDRSAWDKLETLPEEIITEAKADADLIITSCEITVTPTPESVAAVATLREASSGWFEELASKKTAIDAAEKGAETLTGQLTAARTELETLEYANAIFEQMDKLDRAQAKVKESDFWKSNLPVFSQVLRKITRKSKQAHEELIVLDFEVRLNSEYRALTEKDMASFGVVLTRQGADAAVTVTPKIGGKQINGVLSEGEQRIHALALFFAELETCPQSVIVFDDPVSSFDYNYIANYSTRLRDFTMKFPNKQILVLTHNWEFFVQLQTTLNSAALNNCLSVQVLENCAAMANYSEKIDVLKGDITAVLGAAGEPNKSLKEEMAGKMRRLIEAVVNTHVFSNQRHQYKQKSQPVSAFQSFTKIVPLLPTEAMTLRDLYAKLSITEHDDPRNAYVNTDKAIFQSRYNSIIAVETALISRK